MIRHMTKNELDHWYTLQQWPCGHGSSSLFLMGPRGESTHIVRCRKCDLEFRVLIEDYPRLPYGDVLFEPEGYKQPRRVWSETHLWRSLVGPRRHSLKGSVSLVRMAHWLTTFYVVYCLAILGLLYWTHQVAIGVYGLVGLFSFMIVFTLLKRLIRGEKK